MKVIALTKSRLEIVSTARINRQANKKWKIREYLLRKAIRL